MFHIAGQSIGMDFTIVRSDVSELLTDWSNRVNILNKDRHLECPIIQVDEFDKWLDENLKMESQSSSALKQVRTQLHNFGYILDFGETNGLVILDPTWMMNAFKSIFSFK